MLSRFKQFWWIKFQRKFGASLVCGEVDSGKYQRNQRSRTYAPAPAALVAGCTHGHACKHARSSGCRHLIVIYWNLVCLLVGALAG